MAVPPELLALRAAGVAGAAGLWFLLPVRQVMEDRQRRIGTALAAAVLIAWGLGLLIGMINPRYGYPTLPVLCPLAGAAAVAALRRGGKAAEGLRVAVVGVAVMFAVAGVVLAVQARKQPGAMPYLIAAAALAVGTAAWVARGMSASATAWRPAAGLLPLAVLVSVPFGFQRVLARTPTSGLFMVHDLVARAGEHPKVAVGFGLTWKPEIFFYSDARATAYVPTVFDPAHVPPGTWVFVNQDEYKNWRRTLGPRLNHDRLFRRAGESDYYLGWYGPPAECPGPVAVPRGCRQPARQPKREWRGNDAPACPAAVHLPGQSGRPVREGLRAYLLPVLEHPGATAGGGGCAAGRRSPR